MYIAEKVIDVFTLDDAAMLGSKGKIFEVKSKLAKGRNFSHSPVKRLSRYFYKLIYIESNYLSQLYSLLP